MMPLLWLSLAFLAGIVLENLLPWTRVGWLVLAGVALLLAFALAVARRWASRRGRLMPSIPWQMPVPPALLLLALLLGACRAAYARPRLETGSLAWYNDRPTSYRVEGLLITPADERDRYTNLLLEARQLCLEKQETCRPVKGQLLIQVSPGGDWRYGDWLQVTGRLETPPEDEEFSYQDYLARQGIYSWMPQAAAQRLGSGRGNPFLAALFALKEHGLDTLDRLFPEPEASLLAGILLGVDTSIPAAVQKAFQDTGTAHIIAISGFNMSILAGLALNGFRRWLGKWRGAFVALAILGVYTCLVGAGPSVVRAAVMSVFGVFGRQIGRRQDGLNSLAFVAALMALWNPQLLWDVSFQLSFTATLGLILYADSLSAWFEQAAGRRLPQPLVRRLAGPVGDYLLFTLAAQLTTLPVILYHFQRLSLVSLIANPVVLPAQPAVMVLAGLALLLGMLWLPLGQAAAFIAWPFAAFTIRSVEFFSGWPAASLASGPFGLPAVFLFYAILGAATVAGSRVRSHFAAWWKPSLGLAALVALAYTVFQAVLAAPDGRLSLTLLNVSDASGGEALLVRTPAGRHVLINGGPSATRLSDGLGRRLPIFNRRLDWLVVADPGEEQVTSLPRNLERFPVGNVLWAGGLAATRAGRELQASLGQEGIPIQAAEPGQALELGQEITLVVLCANRSGAVLELRWKGFQALLPLGMDAESLKCLLDSPLPEEVSVLMLADGGAAALAPPELLNRLRPELVLLSVAAGDRRGHPDPKALAAVEDLTLLRTDRNGWIKVSTDGEQMWVQAERSQ